MKQTFPLSLSLDAYVRNIIDWGKDRRLNEIRGSLDSLLEESRMRASQTAKSRQPPSNGSATSSGKKHKSSSSRRKSGTSDSMQGQSDRAEEPYLELDETTLQAEGRGKFQAE